MSGRRLAQYEVVEKIGEGGMGEVYRARDTRLGREVALKLLPEAFTRDDERLARFEREARVLAALNHPNVAALYGIEEVEGQVFLVMELVPGEDLAQRLARGPIPLAEARQIALKLVDGLEEAHQKGITHRDLKPANIKITPDSGVKILDFGLARAGAPEAGGGQGFETSPTITAAMTGANVILGTAAYMSPEQARGKVADARSDIWSFGVILYEMLTGRRLFAGDSLTDTLAAVLRMDVDLSELPAGVPPSVCRLLTKTLERDPRRRLRDIADARWDLEEHAAPSAAVVAAARGAAPGEPATTPRKGHHSAGRLAALVAVAALVGMAAGALVSSWLGSGPAAEPVASGLAGARLDLDLTAEGELYRGLGPAAVLSPDGRTVVFVQQIGDDRRLMVRRLDEPDARPLDGTEGALMPFLSPDGQWVGFFNVSSLMKVSLRGGSPLQVCAASGVQVRGAAWGPDDSIVFAADTSQGLSIVPATGGTPRPFTELGARERSHRWPDFTRDGAGVLFLAQYHNQPYDNGSIERVDLATGERTILHQGGAFPRDAGPGRVAFARAGTIFIGRYGAGEGLLGAPSPLLTDVSMNTGDQSGGDGSAQFDMAASGSILYGRGRRSTVLGRLALVDLEGRTLQNLPVEPAEYFFPRASPDGRWLAVTVSNGSALEGWLFGLQGQAARRLTDSAGTADVGLWSPDSQWVFLAAGSDGPRNVVRARVDGSTGMEVVLGGRNDIIPQDMSRDGRWLLVDTYMPDTSWDIFKLPWDEAAPLPLARESMQPLVQSPYQEANPRLSPDLRWLAYASIESGVFEVYVCDFNNPRLRWKLSDRGGEDPMWGPDSDVVYYRRGRTMVESRLTVTDSGLVPAPPRDLFQAPLLERPNDRVIDILPDGSGFAVVLEAAAPEDTYPGEVTLVVASPGM